MNIASVSRLIRVNWLKTIWFNLMYLPFKQGIRFPFLLFGNVKTICKRGNIVFKCPIRVGMVRIGQVSVPWQTDSRYSSYICRGKHLIYGDLAMGGVVCLMS